MSRQTRRRFLQISDLATAATLAGCAGIGDGSGGATDGLALFDAGTEPNGDPGFGPDQAPAQSDPEQGGDEDGVVRPLSDVDDGFSYPDVTDIVQVTLSPEGMDGMGG